MLRTVTSEVDDDVERVIVVSDIHGIYQSLEAFDAIYSNFEGHNLVIFNGDFCFPGMRPIEVFHWIRRMAGENFFLGNHDEDALGDAEGELPLYTEIGAFQRMAKEDREFLISRPHRLDLSWRGRRIVLMHGHLTPEGESASWMTTPEEQTSRFSGVEADLCVLSHSHFAYTMERNSTVYANCGSISLPLIKVEKKDGVHFQGGRQRELGEEEIRSSFLCVSEEGGNLEIEVVRFDYDRQAALEEMELSGQPDVENNRLLLEEGIIRLTD